MNDHVFPDRQYPAMNVYDVKECRRCGAKARFYKYLDTNPEVPPRPEFLSDDNIPLKYIPGCKRSDPIPLPGDDGRPPLRHKFEKTDMKDDQGNFYYACECGERMIEKDIDGKLQKLYVNSQGKIIGKIKRCTIMRVTKEMLANHTKRKYKPRKAQIHDRPANKPIITPAVKKSVQPTKTWLEETIEKQKEKMQEDFVAGIMAGEPTKELDVNNIGFLWPKSTVSDAIGKTIMAAPDFSNLIGQINELAPQLFKEEVEEEEPADITKTHFRTIIPLTETESRLVEAYTCLRLLYEDMISMGMRTRARDMASRIINSERFDEAVNNLKR